MESAGESGFKPKRQLPAIILGCVLLQQSADYGCCALPMTAVTRIAIIILAPSSA